MCKEIKPVFVVSKDDGKYWVEIKDEAGLLLSKTRLMGFSLSNASSSKEEAQEIADFLNNNIDKLLLTPF